MIENVSHELVLTKVIHPLNDLDLVSIERLNAIKSHFTNFLFKEDDLVEGEILGHYSDEEKESLKNVNIDVEFIFKDRAIKEATRKIYEKIFDTVKNLCKNEETLTNINDFKGFKESDHLEDIDYFLITDIYTVNNISVLKNFIPYGDEIHNHLPWHAGKINNYIVYVDPYMKDNCFYCGPLKEMKKLKLHYNNDFMKFDIDDHCILLKCKYWLKNYINNDKFVKIQYKENIEK